MAVSIRNVPYNINEIALAQKLRPVLHGPPFSDVHDTLRHATPMNFHVRLIPDKRVRHLHTRKGVITFPSQELADLAVGYFTDVHNFSITNKVIRFEASREPPQRNLLADLQRLPYRDPQEILKPRNRLIDVRSEDTEEVVEACNVQFMYECRDWVLSPEWEWCPNPGYPFQLRLEETTRELVIEKFESQNSSTMIRIRYLSVKCIDLDTKTCSFVIYLSYAPSYEQATYPPSRLKAPRNKLIALDSEHMEVAPFTWCCIRVVCQSSRSINSFRSMAEMVKIPVTERDHEVLPRARYSQARRQRLQNWLATINWEVAFQYELMYRDILLDPKEIWKLKRPTEDAIASRLGVQGTVNVLRRFRPKLKNSTNWAVNEEISLFSLFRDSVNEVAELGTDFAFETGTSHFMCHHAYFTPSLMRLEGPLLDVSNRILRAYPEHQNHFLRVSFVDEEHMKLFLDRRKVDGSGFVHDRVGSILKKGFVLCGRPYKFLGYSQSALKDHTVWFVSPFKRGNVVVDAEYIRSGIGTRWPQELLRCPARYAARLSQAFTATDRGLIIEEDEIELIPDIERNGYCFTDGNGLVSLEMAKAIYAGIKGRRPTEISRTPSVFQLRLQGAKGIITVDPSLDGLILQLRPSMVKFTSRHSEVEIARSFERPVRFFLNKPLTMILGGLGVAHSVFLKLQRLAVREAEESTKSFKKAAGLFETHGLGRPFSLSAIFHNLRKIGVPFEKGSENFINPFVDRCLRYAVHHVLREIKTKGRIPVPGCWKLVGTVDVYNELAPNEIFVQIIRGPGSRPEYLQGPVLMAKSPTIHPGDVQMVYAIGPPPSNSYFRHLANCVVFSQQGDRPLPNQLSGSDLDGDEYDLIPFPELHPPETVDPGSYPPAPKKLLDHNATIDDIADFVVDFINSDVLGLVAMNFLFIADRYSIFHEDCAKLAELHSWAVDFPKNGKPVPFKEIPFPEGCRKPDWHAPEVNTKGHEDKYYESKSILGVLFRDIKLPYINTHLTGGSVDDKDDATVSITNTLDNLQLSGMPLNDAVSRCLRAQLEHFIDLAYAHETAAVMLDLFSHFSFELHQIACQYPLAVRSVKPLSEEEILVGTIIGKTSQHAARLAKITGMRDAAGHLVRRTMEELEGGVESPIKDWANRAWMAWKISIMKRDTFGAKCFGFVSLRALFDVLNLLDTGTDIGDY